MAGGPLVTQAYHKTSYKRKDIKIKKTTQQTVKESKRKHSTHTGRHPDKENPSSHLHSLVARSPALLIFLYHKLLTPYLYIHTFGSPNCTLKKDNQ